MRFARRLVLLAVACVPLHAAAARPMTTDDARLVDAKACQVESWVRFERHGTQAWAVPACNLTGNLELTLGGALTHDGEGTRVTDQQAQAKTLLRPLSTNSWGVGAALGTVGHPGRRRDVYGYIPASLSLLDDRVVLHANAGALRVGDEGRTKPTWGLATETQLAPRTWLVAEIFGARDGRPFHHIGVRQWLVENRLQVDVTYGNRNGSSAQERWFSLGLRVLTPALLP